MNLQDFVDSLSLDTYDNLRMAVVNRQRRQAEAFVVGLEYLVSQPVLMKAARINPEACIKIISEKTNFPPELMKKVVDKYRANPNEYSDVLEVVEINNSEDVRSKGEIRTDEK